MVSETWKIDVRLYTARVEKTLIPRTCGCHNNISSHCHIESTTFQQLECFPVQGSTCNPV